MVWIACSIAIGRRNRTANNFETNYAHNERNHLVSHSYMLTNYSHILIGYSMHACSPEFQYSCGRTSQIWQVSPNAMRARTADRISQLARHKTAPAGYLEHRYRQIDRDCVDGLTPYTIPLPLSPCTHAISLLSPSRTPNDFFSPHTLFPLHSSLFICLHTLQTPVQV